MKIKIELVTKVNKELYENVHEVSHQEKESLWFMHDGWYEEPTIQHSWNTERYIIYNNKNVIGFFILHKYHNHLRANVNAFYLLPDYRGAIIPFDVVLFIGNRIFIELGYNKITASAWELNKRIVRLFDTFMNREGEFREHFYYERRFNSSIKWGITYKDSIWKNGEYLTLEDIKKQFKIAFD